MKIKTPTSSYVVHYPQAIEFAETQEKIFWTANEIAVEKDIQDLRVNMTEAEHHGVITTLKLFTLYELVAGNEYWLGRVREAFPRPEIQRMAASFGFFELNVHAPFYNRLNEALYLNTEEFYNNYVKDPVLVERKKFIDGVVADPDDLVSLGTFSLVEGAVLYSSFAFLKHFQTKGKNKLLNVVRGINFSVRDENLHAMAGAWLFKRLAHESDWQDYDVSINKIVEAAYKIYEHEERIIDMIFEKGKIEGITDHQMKCFVQSRINICLKNLGIEPLFEVKYNPIADWFYDSINAVQFHDFFTGVGNEYNRDWNEKGFKW